MKVTVLDTPIAQLFSDASIFKYPTEKIWNRKGISLAKRLADEPDLKERIDKAVSAANLKQYIVPVDSKAPTRCIDGRQVSGWGKLTDKHRKTLGPKVPGGTAHAALAHRIVNSTDLSSSLHFEDDIKAVVHLYKKIGRGFGGHVDTHQNGWNTGCGAVDNINLILHKLQRPEPQEQIRFLAREMMGKAYDEVHVVNEVIGSMLLLDAIKPSYMPKEGGVPEGEFLYKKTVVDLLRAEMTNGGENVPELAGDHKEAAIVLNWIPSTTFDNDRFCADSKGELQVFGWDIWEVYEEASQLYPYSMYDAPEVQHSLVAKRIKHITTRILLGIATTMVLTDGSLKLVTVK